jgi:ATP-dependent DNA helicase RecQ
VLFNDRSYVLLASDASFVVKLPKEKPPVEKDGRAPASSRTRRASTSTGAAASDWEAAVDPQLFERLRELRFSLAREADMPAYIVFADVALREMAARKPQTPDEFLQISGVGTVKLERYGTAFLTCIQDYLAK